MTRDPANGRADLPPAEPALPAGDPQVRAVGHHERTGANESGGEPPAPAPWRSLDEWDDTAEFQAALTREHPASTGLLTDPISRRSFLKLMGASLALSGLNACRSPRQRILPYNKQPQDVIPGKPLFFATAMPLGGYGTGVLVESHMGRPTKIEGNPSHPASLGAADATMQASILGLYDPDRSQALRRQGGISTWPHFVRELLDRLNAPERRDGSGLRLLTGCITSPTLAGQLQDILQRYPQARWHAYDLLNDDSARQGARLACGQDLQAQYRLDQAEVVLSLDADFLTNSPARLRHGRDWAKWRQSALSDGRMNRLYVAESTATITGAIADACLPVRASDIEGLTRALAAALGVANAIPAYPLSGPQADWLNAVTTAIKQAPGRSLVIPGDYQPATVHALAMAINDVLGNIGRTVVYTAPVPTVPTDSLASLRDLITAMQAGQVDTLIVAGPNPAYSATADLPFAAALARVPFSVYLGGLDDETASLCLWHVPETHYLEAWSDIRAFDGTVSIVQPLIAPLYEGKSIHDLFAVLQGQPDRSGYDLVRAHWQSQVGTAGFEAFWERALITGTVPGTQASAITPRLRPSLPAPPGLMPADSLEINFRPDPYLWDGQFANNGWLQELPRPLSKLTWDNAALISPATARRLGLTNDDVVQLDLRGQSVTAPVWIQPGQPDNAVTLHLGYGRRLAGQIGSGVGVDAQRLRQSTAPWFDTGLTITPTGARHALATTQHDHLMRGRDLVQRATLAKFAARPDFAKTPATTTPDLTFAAPRPDTGHRWGMVVNLNTCIGCNACVMACQAENNIPIVGREQVLRHRAMHWLRVDRYYQGDPANPETTFQPVPCMHCEQAPCEVVCPVEATVHSHEGLNDMVYNRCIGTRYCSNNCPYKVRRFNFLPYADSVTPVTQLVHNPDVTVRSRGVMEKCTYCIQRIEAARIDAAQTGRPIADGEVLTACQQTCPTNAIVFGDLADPSSQVRAQTSLPTHYALLADLNTRPRTTYLAKLTNPDPDLAGD